MSQFLFDRGECGPRSPAEVAGEADTDLAGTPRLRVPQRTQIEMHWASLDELLDEDHPARMVWEAVCKLQLGAWLREIKAVEGQCGRDATDPRLLVAIWVYATLDGQGSARQIARLCEKHLAYQWLCGGVTVNHNLLSAFRCQEGEKWDALLTQMVAALMAEGLVELRQVAQDGMRVRASAGKDTFRRQRRLEECLEEARGQVETLKQLADDSPELTRRQQVAREQAACERLARIESAIRNCDELKQQRQASAEKSGRDPKEPRASTTDPEAREMKMPDGGTRPAYNVQFSTDTQSGIIVGVDANNQGSDQQQLPPMLDQIQERYGQVPEEALVDGGFASKDTIDGAAARGCTVYAPLKQEEKQLAEGKNPYARKPGDSPAVEAWRGRMGTAEARATYQMRCQTAEWVNAQARNRGLQQFRVRGQAKCRIVATLLAIAHNLVQALTLRAKAAQMAT